MMATPSHLRAAGLDGRNPSREIIAADGWLAYWPNAKVEPRVVELRLFVEILPRAVVVVSHPTRYRMASPNEVLLILLFFRLVTLIIRIAPTRFK